MRRVDSPPATSDALSHWTHRLPTLPSGDWPSEGSNDATEARAAYESLSIQDKAAWQNPFRDMYEPDPFEWKNTPDYSGPDWIRRPSPSPKFDFFHPAPAPTPPAPKLDISSLPKLQKAKLLHDGHDSSVFRAETDEGVRLLKVYHRHSFMNFEHERDAYSRLLSAGVCATKSVPDFYGWLEITVESIRASPSTWLDHFKTYHLDADEKRYLIVTEYIRGTAMSTRNINTRTATAALHALAAVHSAHVKHNDAVPRHFIITKQERVVIVDFVGL